jgi:hypothetical protein
MVPFTPTPATGRRAQNRMWCRTDLAFIFYFFTIYLLFIFLGGYPTQVGKVLSVLQIDKASAGYLQQKWPRKPGLPREKQRRSQQSM